MTVWSAAALVSVCFVLMSLSSVILGRSLDRLSVRFRLSGGLLGMIAALGADAPEISSAVTAIFAKQHDIGVGIIIGSNIFNLAALLGVSALLVGRLPVRRPAILFIGTAAMLATLVLVLLLFRSLPPWISLGCLLLMLVPYLIVLGSRPAAIERWRLPVRLRSLLTVAIAQSHHVPREHTPKLRGSWSGPWWGSGAVIMIIGTSIGMVHSAVFLSHTWGLSTTIVGTLILAILTSIPNVITTLKLALAGKGVAVMSEALSSNNLNILFGICLPATLFGLGTLARQTVFSLWWLVGMTMVSIGFGYFKKAFDRWSGAVNVGLYLAFAGILIFWRP